MTITPPATIDAPMLAKQLRATFESGRTRPLAWRKQQLAGLRRMLDECEGELVDALHDDLGRPRMEAFAADIGHTKAELRQLARHIDGWVRPTKVRVPLTVAPAKAWNIYLGVAVVVFLLEAYAPFWGFTDLKTILILELMHVPPTLLIVGGISRLGLKPATVTV